MMLLLVCTNETISSALGLGELNAEFLVSLPETFIPCTKGVNSFHEAILFLVGCAVRYGKLRKLVTKLPDGFLKTP